MLALIGIGELAALATALSWSFTSLFYEITGRQVGSGNVNRARLFVACIMLSVIHYFLEGSWFPLDAGGYRWFWLTVSSLLGLVIGDATLFYAFELIGARLSMLIFASVPVISLGFGYLFFEETLTRPELIGMAITLGAIAWVVTERVESTESEADPTSDDPRYGLGVLMAFLGALGQAGNLLTSKFGLVGDYSPLSATTIRLYVAMVVMWVIALGQRRFLSTIHIWQQKENRTAAWLLMAGTLVGPVIGIWTSLIAIQYTRLGIASTIIALPPVLLIPIERIVLGKRVSWRAIIGTAIALFGVAMIFLLGGG